ncbi:MAG: transglutaminase family protein [Verrucomicrobiales bacterium]|nr:transglutaminase family protein [Verrucomicrobiales bacterium]
MRLSISHLTRYLYTAPARSNINELRLTPEENNRQKPGELSISVDPVAELREMRDLFGNLVHHFEVEEGHEELTIQSRSEVETRGSLDSAMRSMSVPLREFISSDNESLYEFTTDSTFVFKNSATWREAVDVHLSCEKTWGSLIQGLSDFVFEYCQYEDQSIHRMATSSEVQECKVGTCQDFSHLLISYCRALGMPARYLSGYLYDPGLDCATNAEFIGSGATHAWVEVHVPSIGWVGIDPTNRRWVDEHYVSISFGRDYHDVAPVRGSLIGGGIDRSLEVEVAVRAIQ